MNIKFVFEGKTYEADVARVKMSLPQFFITIKNENLIKRFGAQHIISQDAPGQFAFAFPNSSSAGQNFMYTIAKGLSECLHQNAQK